MKKPNLIDQQITFLYTQDLVTSAKFYEEVMDLKLALDQGTCRIYQVAPNSYLGICERCDVIVDPAFIIFTLVTQDVDGWYEMLLQKGVEIENPPKENPHYQIYHFFIRDPNGYQIEIQRFEDDRWCATLFQK